MHNLKTLAILAPAALALAACGGNADDETTSGNETVAEATPGAVDFPAVPADARGTVDFAGAYEQRSNDGRMRTVTLNADDTFKTTDIEGVETSGTYSWYSDNSRVLIKEGEANRIFAVANGAIYEMADKDAPTTGTMTEGQTFRKSITISY